MLIAALEKQNEKNKKGNRSRNNPKTPMLDSMIKSAPAALATWLTPVRARRIGPSSRPRAPTAFSNRCPKASRPSTPPGARCYYRRLAEEKTIKPAAGDATEP